jgi:hypothetical protein
VSELRRTPVVLGGISGGLQSRGKRQDEASKQDVHIRRNRRRQELLEASESSSNGGGGLELRRANLAA